MTANRKIRIFSSSTLLNKMYIKTKIKVILKRIVANIRGAIETPLCSNKIPTTLISVKIPRVSKTAFFTLSELTFLYLKRVAISRPFKIENTQKRPNLTGAGMDSLDIRIVNIKATKRNKKNQIGFWFRA